MAFEVSHVQPTPNPNAFKFILDRQITEQPLSFFNAASAHGHPLAARLFEIGGVSSLLLLDDFITINKSPEARWDDITTQVKAALSDL